MAVIPLMKNDSIVIRIHAKDNTNAAIPIDKATLKIDLDSVPVIEGDVSDGNNGNASFAVPPDTINAVGRIAAAVTIFNSTTLKKSTPLYFHVTDHV